MDAQNAVEPDQTKPLGAVTAVSAPNPKREDQAAQQPTATATGTKRNLADLPSDRSVAGFGAAEAPSATPRRLSDLAEDRDSDAETIVLPGKDGHSPSKARKVRHEDKSDSESQAAKTFVKPAPSSSKISRSSNDAPIAASSPSVGAATAAPAGLRRNSVAGTRHAAAVPASVAAAASADPIRSQTVDVAIATVSSAPLQPSRDREQQRKRRRRASDAGPSSSSDLDSFRNNTAASPKASISAEKQNSIDSHPLHKRKVPKVESDDENGLHNARRPRHRSSGPDGDRARKDSKPALVKASSAVHDHLSTSPPPRLHRRSASSQLPAYVPTTNTATGSNPLPKKKRLPPPLQPPDSQSEDSSTGGSPRPRGQKLRGLATPAMADLNVSPAKMAPHKKHLDAHGQTLLARACARGEYDTAKQRLGERPEDLNVADYAGNTPLQIAAINGCEDIVKLLIDAGCHLDCINYDKDTPLLDAVDNGHLSVVKLLLDAGINPRKANMNGEEPLDRVSDDADHADEIRAALLVARKRAEERRRTSEDHHSHNDPLEARDSHAPDSPRHSPPTTSTGRRSGTVRSTKTRNDLLYMPLDDKTLRQAAGRGDEETVARILQVKEGYDDPESMVAAARGGHDLVIQLLLGLGGANADPAPVPTLPAEFATPILAAIGQENIKVVELLLEQQGFDPTRRFKGETYHDIARRRQGTNWKEEEQILKNAYDAYKRAHRDLVKVKSPTARREREREWPEKPARRDEPKDASKTPKRQPSSVPHESEARRKSSTSKPLGTQPPKRSDSTARRSEDETRKPSSDKVRKDPAAALPSDLERSPSSFHKQPAKPKRIESDLASVMSSEGEAKPRRKLVSKGELSRERDKQKNPHKEPSSPHDIRVDEATEKSKLSERYHDRTKALKRTESRDHHKSSESVTKRHRSSLTPDQSSDADVNQNEGPSKRRRLDSEGSELRRKNPPPTKEGQPRKVLSGRDAPSQPSQKPTRKERDNTYKESHDQRPSQRHPPARKSSKDLSIHVKSEDPDVPMVDVPQPDSGRHRPRSASTQADDRRVKEVQPSASEARGQAERQRRENEAPVKKHEEGEAHHRRDVESKPRRTEEEKKKCEMTEARRRQEHAARERQDTEEANRRQELETKRLAEERRKKKKKEEEEQKRRDDEERLRRERLQREAAVEARKQREAAEQARKQREAEESARKQREVEEQALRQREAAEQARKQREAEEQARKKREAEEQARKQREAEEQARKKCEAAEQARKQREAEEQARKQREEEEAAASAAAAQRKREQEEEARRRREKEEEARKERERRKRAHREELERKRAAREAEQQRIREEQERVRLEKLPALLQWLSTHPNPRAPYFAKKFRYILGVRYDTIKPNTNGTAQGREQWVLNTEVALLLGEKDLGLSRYTAWERVPASYLAKMTIWRTEGRRYALVDDKLWDIGRQLPGYYGENDTLVLNFEGRQRLLQAAWDKFLAMDLFFVKVSDLMYTIGNVPHLLNMQVGVLYRELMESENQGWTSASKWKNDPDVDRFHGHAPRCKYFINGEFASEVLPTFHETSRTPFLEKRVPRRGLVQAVPGDPDYEELCLQQGLGHLLRHTASSIVQNGIQTSPSPGGEATKGRAVTVNGVNGHTTSEASVERNPSHRAALNGITDSEAAGSRRAS